MVHEMLVFVGREPTLSSNNTVKIPDRVAYIQCRSKGNISGGARKCWRREPLGGSGGMLLQKNLKSISSVLQELFVIYAYRELFTSYTVLAHQCALRV